MPGNPPQLHLSWVIDGTDTITYRRSRMRCEGFPEPMHDMLDCSDEPLQPNVSLRPVGIQALQPVSPDGHVRGSLADSLVRGTRSVTIRAEGSMWWICTEAVVRLHGVDSTSFYLGLARARARRSLTAGEAPFSGIDYGWGRGDSLQFGLTETPLRCGELMTQNCLEDATDPELRFTPVGLLPFFRGDTTAAGRVP